MRPRRPSAEVSMLRHAFAIAFLAAFAHGCSDDSRRPNSFLPETSDLGLASPDMGHGGGTVDPAIVSRSTLSVAEAETHVAVADNGYVAIAYITILANGGSNNGYVFSTDDGMTWGKPQSIKSPGLRVSSDPVLAADQKGNFYLTWIGFDRTNTGGATNMHVYVAVAPAGTTTFGAPVDINGADEPSLDKPWVTVDNDGSVVITWVALQPSVVYAGRSTDGGQTWDVQTVTSGGFRNLVFPCHGSTGNRLYVVYHSGGGIGLRWSDDGGTTWSDADKTAVAMQGDQPAFDDPTCAVDGSDVWVSYGLSPDQFNGSTSAKLDTIRVAHSSDGGKTFADYWDAQDGSAASYFLHPYLVRERSTGALDLVYYAGGFEKDPDGSFRWARSTDGGKTWGASTAVATPITYLAARADPKWLGDYVGLAWARDNLYVAYADNHGVLPHIAFYRTAAPPNP
jgi:hypothetical protein